MINNYPTIREASVTGEVTGGSTLIELDVIDATPQNLSTTSSSMNVEARVTLHSHDHTHLWPVCPFSPVGGRSQPHFREGPPQTKRNHVRKLGGPSRKCGSLRATTGENGQTAPSHPQNASRPTQTSHKPYPPRPPLEVALRAGGSSAQEGPPRRRVLRAGETPTRRNTRVPCSTAYRGGDKYR